MSGLKWNPPAQSSLKSLGSHPKASWWTETVWFKRPLSLLLVRLAVQGEQNPSRVAGLCMSLLIHWHFSQRNSSGRGSSGPAPGYKGNWLKASSSDVISWTLSCLGAARTTLFGWLLFFSAPPPRATRGPPWICTIKLLSVLNRCSEDYNGICLKESSKISTLTPRVRAAAPPPLCLVCLSAKWLY